MQVRNKRFYGEQDFSQINGFLIKVVQSTKRKRLLSVHTLVAKDNLLIFSFGWVAMQYVMSKRRYVEWNYRYANAFLLVGQIIYHRNAWQSLIGLKFIRLLIRNEMESIKLYVYLFNANCRPERVIDLCRPGGTRYWNTILIIAQYIN